MAKVLRLCAAYDFPQLWWTGNRVRLSEYEGEGRRLPREERMKGYGSVKLVNHDKPFDQFGKSTVIAIELTPGAESLHWFDFPPNPVFVFGPEDGSLGKVTKSFCHRFVQIPVKHCLNLATAVATVLWAWHHPRVVYHLRPELELAENRGVERSHFA